MMRATSSDPAILIGASIPRSGHHFLADMLTAYYGDRLYYCEYYTLATCCKAVPCTRRGGHEIVYQKSHDRDFKLAADVSDALYLIQYRHPIPEALSDRELELQEKLGRTNLAYRSTRAGYANWLAGKAVYYRKFHDKWIANRMTNAIYLDYAELAADAKPFLKTIVERTTGPADEARLDQVIEKTRSPRSNANFKPRVAEDSPYFDAELLAPLEAWVLERCPAYNFTSQLNGSYAGSELFGLILLRDPTQPLPRGETKRFKVAAELAPHHPEIQKRLAGRALREGRVPQAMKRLEKLVEEHPYFPGAYEMLFKICGESGTAIPEFALTGNALVACSESAELSMRLGEAFGGRGLWLNAIAAYSIAAALQPRNKDALDRQAEAIQNAR
ncbi:MAG TPA: hypothetical protein VHE09_01490 [Rhizomicrobium sp.]|nr:hypothetical protein [Rhizomicrobium sp.]